MLVFCCVCVELLRVLVLGYILLKLRHRFSYPIVALYMNYQSIQGCFVYSSFVFTPHHTPFSLPPPPPQELALTIESLKAHHADNLEHYATLEAERAGLVREVDELSSWKAVYEAGHGLQEMSRNQVR